jgi:transcriptional regulator with XRE-family HTH domain
MGYTAAVKPKSAWGVVHPEAAFVHDVCMSKPPHFIREWRKHRGLTLEQLAERIGMTHQNLGRIERFLVPYNQRALEALAEALRTEPASLVMRNPLQTDAPWELAEKWTPQERDIAIAMIRALRQANAPKKSKEDEVA